MATIIGKDERARETAQWLRWADADYLAARLLLVNGAIPQGAALANTAIEKYLKAIFLLTEIEIPRTHDVLDLYKTIRKTKDSTLVLDEGFLRLLRKAYLLRYPDELEDGFNISMNGTKVLTQTDRSVLEITNRFSLIDKGKQSLRILERAVRDNDQRLLVGNVAVFTDKVKELFAHPSTSFDLRKHLSNTLEAIYVTEYVVDDLKFDVQGLRRINERSFEFGHTPIVQPKKTP